MRGGVDRETVGLLRRTERVGEVVERRLGLVLRVTLRFALGVDRAGALRFAAGLDRGGALRFVVDGRLADRLRLGARDLEARGVGARRDDRALDLDAGL